MKLVTVIGARPQFIKAAVVSRAVCGVHEEILVHTGQHYDINMSDVFFKELDIPQPRYNLGIGSASHGRMTGRMLESLEKVLLEHRPDAVLVYGDTNSTLAGALAASKLNIPVVHIEAGLRSYNMRMPEEQNRLLTDHISTLLLCPTKTAVGNLYREGIRQGVFNTGDVMYDAVLYSLDMAEKKKDFHAYLEGLTPSLGTGLQELAGIKAKEYYLATVHREENTQTPESIKTILASFGKLPYPVLFPIHPRTRRLIESVNIPFSNILFVEPTGYLEMLILTHNAGRVLTDSGGLQKEAYFLDVPCVTLRAQTEWPETLKNGCNVLVPIDEQEIMAKAAQPFRKKYVRHKNIFGDGKAAFKIIDALKTLS